MNPKAVLKNLLGRTEKPLDVDCSMLSARSVTAEEAEKIRHGITSLGSWFHNYEIAKGIWTNAEGASPGPDYPARRWSCIKPWFADLHGKTCLDVGCSSGFFSLKAAELGASVLGVDSGEQPLAVKQARFAAETLRLSPEFDSVSVYDLAQIGRTFDVVLFMGVLYHLRHPLLALEALRKVCHGQLILQTITTPSLGRIEEVPGVSQNVQLNSKEMHHERFPAMSFVEGALAGDVTCWFVPNVEAVAAMLRSSGFTPKEFVFPNTQEVFIRFDVI
jgi:tRNA (mo5U34)-methyltransferase